MADAMDRELRDWVRRAFEQGMAEQEVRRQLAAAGHQPTVIDRVIAAERPDTRADDGPWWHTFPAVLGSPSTFFVEKRDRGYRRPTRFLTVTMLLVVALPLLLTVILNRVAGLGTLPGLDQVAAGLPLLLPALLLAVAVATAVTALTFLVLATVLHTVAERMGGTGTVPGVYGVLCFTAAVPATAFLVFLPLAAAGLLDAGGTGALVAGVGGAVTGIYSLYVASTGVAAVEDIQRWKGVVLVAPVYLLALLL